MKQKNVQNFKELLVVCKRTIEIDLHLRCKRTTDIYQLDPSKKMQSITYKTTYLALLRGINVGGNNIIKMADLKSAFEEMGFSDVKTYIQSGNVIFNSEKKNKAELTDEIERKLSEKFSYNSIIVLLTKEELEEQLASAPKDYGTENENYRYDVIFLKETITVEEGMKDISLREGIDEVFIGTNILFFQTFVY